MDMDTFARAARAACTSPNTQQTHNNFVDRNADLSDTLRQHMFIVDVIPRSFLPAQRNGSSPDAPNMDDLGASLQSPSSLAEQHCETNGQRRHKTLDDLEDDIRELEDFITVTEDVLWRERQRDREFYARERRRQRRIVEQQHVQIICNGRTGNHTKTNNNRDVFENNAANSATTMVNAASSSSVSINPIKTSPPTCPIYSLKSPTYKRPMHAALRKCKSAAPVPGHQQQQSPAQYREQQRLSRQSWPNDCESMEAISPNAKHSERPSTASSLKELLRKQKDFDRLGSSVLNELSGMTESEFDPECLKRRQSDVVNGLDTSMDKLMGSSDETGGSLEMVVVVTANGRGDGVGYQDAPSLIESQPLRAESAHSDAS